MDDSIKIPLEVLYDIILEFKKLKGSYSTDSYIKIIQNKIREVVGK